MPFTETKKTKKIWVKNEVVDEQFEGREGFRTRTLRSRTNSTQFNTTQLISTIYDEAWNNEAIKYALYKYLILLL